MHKKFDTMLLTGMLADGEKDGSFILQELGIQPYYIQSMKRSINPFQDIKSLVRNLSMDTKRKTGYCTYPCC
jgi:hypothetical protein